MQRLLRSRLGVVLAFGVLFLGRRPLHLGAGGFGASQRGISAGPGAVR